MEEAKTAQQYEPITTLQQYVDSRIHAYIFSPHLDDAILSMGSLMDYIASRSISIQVISIFTQGSPSLTPATTSLLANAGFSDVLSYFQARRDEDTKAINRINKDIAITYLGFTDSAWRVSKSGQAYYPNTQSLETINPEEKTLQEHISEKIKQLVSPTPSMAVFAPLARGKHIDHQITRNIVSQLFPQAIFYSDFPYTTAYENEDVFISQHHLFPVVWNNMSDKKKEAIVLYKTQQKSFSQYKNFDFSKEVFYWRPLVV